MRAARFASWLVTSLVVLPACDDSNAAATPVSVEWLEWSDSVVAGAPFGVRVRGAGVATSDVRVTLRVRGDTVAIELYSVAMPCRATCPPIALPVYDTLVLVPAIDAASPRTVTIRAASRWPALEQPWPLRTFGTVTVSPTAPVQALMRSVGVASGFQDSFGCFIVMPGPPFGVYISADQAPTWAPGFTGFVYGRVDPALQSTCVNAAPVIQVDSIAQ
jgi:hypothetical protein